MAEHSCAVVAAYICNNFLQGVALFLSLGQALLAQTKLIKGLLQFASEFVSLSLVLRLFNLKRAEFRKVDNEAPRHRQSRSSEAH
jgi:hypothetical protein